MNIWQRLNTVLMLLIILLLAAVGLAMWVESARSGAEQRRADLLRAKDRIAYNVLLINESLHLSTLDPKNEYQQKRRREAESELRGKINDLLSLYANDRSFSTQLRELNEFVFGTSPGTLGSFKHDVLEMAEKEPGNTTTYYNNKYPALIRQREQLFRDLGLQVDILAAEFDQHAQRVSMAGLSGLIFILVASLFIGRFQSSTIAEPLNRLVGTLDKMRQGDFTVRVSMPQQDEFGTISRGLNGLADELCELVGQVQQSGIQVNTTASQIAFSAKEQQSTAAQIASTSGEIESKSKQISATSQQLVLTMNEVNEVAEAAARIAGSGQHAIARMEATMKQIIEASGSVTSKLAVLSEKTANINSVVTTITKVADQTNLLSLNAAIEAEKAGEYGLGFAVVAMEIRRLADQTAVATFDIEKMVKEMQSAVAAGVMGMDKFSEEARRGVDDVRHVGGQLAQVIKDVQALTPRFQTVSLGVQAQASSAQHISETLTRLTEAAKQTAESLRQSTLAIEQLNGAARSIHASVARFRLHTPGKESTAKQHGTGI